MFLIELLEHINDNTTVQCYENGMPLFDGLYDGKNSINEKYNSYIVLDVTTENNVLNIDIRKSVI